MEIENPARQMDKYPSVEQSPRRTNPADLGGFPKVWWKLIDHSGTIHHSVKNFHRTSAEAPEPANSGAE